MRRLAAYVSGPHSSLPSEVQAAFQERCELIQEVCEDEHYTCYCPHQHASLDQAEVAPGEIYRNAADAIGSAELLIADCSLPAAGVGAACQIANDLDVPVLLVAQQGTVVSRMIRGLPAAVKAGGEADIVRFTDDAELGHRLRDRLVALKEPLMMNRERRNAEGISLEALREYARTRHIPYARYQRLRSLVAAAVGGNIPRSAEDWEALDIA